MSGIIVSRAMVSGAIVSGVTCLGLLCLGLLCLTLLCLGLSFLGLSCPGTTVALATSTQYCSRHNHTQLGYSGYHNYHARAINTMPVPLVSRHYGKTGFQVCCWYHCRVYGSANDVMRIKKNVPICIQLPGQQL